MKSLNEEKSFRHSKNTKESLTQLYVLIDKRKKFLWNKLKLRTKVRKYRIQIAHGLLLLWLLLLLCVFFSSCFLLLLLLLSLILFVRLHAACKLFRSFNKWQWEREWIRWARMEWKGGANNRFKSDSFGMCKQFLPVHVIVCQCAAEMNNRDNKKTVICHLSNLRNIKIGDTHTHIGWKRVLKRSEIGGMMEHKMRVSEKQRDSSTTQESKCWQIQIVLRASTCNGDKRSKSARCRH